MVKEVFGVRPESVILPSDPPHVVGFANEVELIIGLTTVTITVSDKLSVQSIFLTV